MKQVVAAVAVFALLGCFGPVHAQTQNGEHPSHIPTRQDPNSPFSPQFAKPSGTTGGTIYRDPRQADPNGPYKQQRSTGCPAPKMYDPASGGCK